MKKHFLFTKERYFFASFLTLLVSLVASAQTEVPCKTTEFKDGHVATLQSILQADKQKQSSESLRSAKEKRNKIEEFEKRSGRRLNPAQRKKGQTNLQKTIGATTDADASRISAIGSQPPTPILNFVGAELLEPGNLGVTPPDVVGDVGPKDIVSVTNERIRIINKSNIADVISFSIDNFFSAGLGIQTVTSDPHVRFDRLSSRWFFCAISLDRSFSNDLLIAVSRGSDISDTSTFIFYAFRYDRVITPGSDISEGFLDYPTLGVDAHAVLIGGNVFNNDYVGSVSFVINKKALLQGVLKVSAFYGGKASTLYTPQGVHNDNSTERFSYFACTDNTDYSLLHILRVRYRADSVAGSTLYDLTSPTGPTYPVPTKDAPVVLDGLDDRFLAAMIMKNKITGESTLATAHQFHMDAAGNPSETGGRLGVRWYEINNLTQAPTIKQRGTLVDANCDRPFTFWNGTIALNGQGHMLLSASRSSQFTFPEAVISGRLACDPPGYTQPHLQVSQAKGRYNFDLVSILYGGERWGDYSQVVVDPTDNMTMWAFGEFGSNSHFVDSLGNTQFNMDTTYNWAVQVTEIRAPAPPKFKIEFDRINQAQIKITGMGGSCEGFFDPGAGYQKRLKAQIFGANSVQVKRVTVIDAANLIVTVNDRQFVPGSYILVITNPDGQSSFQTFSINQSFETQANHMVVNEEHPTTKELNVFPNPAASTITVQTGGLLANSTIEVFDMNGSSVLKKFAIEKQTSIRIDISRFASGTYFIQVKNNKESYATKFVVNR